MPKHADKDFSFWDAFDADSELAQYGSNALSIFALSLYLRIDDLSEFASQSITDGVDDKKTDLVFIDLTESRVVIAQSYLSETRGKSEAPSNKASALASSIGWLLSSNQDTIPPHLKQRAIELREELINGSIKRVEIWYIHNCFESTNVKNELNVVANTARNAINALLSEESKNSVTVIPQEMGLESIQDLFESRDKEILIDGWLHLPIDQYVTQEGEEWTAILTTVSGDWIKTLHDLYGNRLFSANYRDYLQSSPSSSNINYEIRTTAESEPNNFWVYNNGITALTYQIDLDNSRIRGISIINGAQTSGSLSEANEAATENSRVLIRIVQCSSPALIDKIIRFNNTQNELKPADRRSRDSTQERLNEEFEILGIQYVHRRSTVRAPKNAITSNTIARVLCAFHGDPQIPSRNANEIFNNDDIYEKVFPRNISIGHVFLARTLSLAVDVVKSDLGKKASSKVATDIEEKEYDVLKYSASRHFIFYLIGLLAEELMGRRISILFDWRCKPNVIQPDNVSMQLAWITALHALLPHIATILDKRGKYAFYEVLRSKEQSEEVAGELKPLIASLLPVIESQFSGLRQRTTA